MNHKTHAMKKHTLPISRKAYEGFRERIRTVSKAFGFDAAVMLTILDQYLDGDKNAGASAPMPINMAFQMLRFEIDRAITRSARARENARLRRERRQAERTNVSDMTENTSSPHPESESVAQTAQKSSDDTGGFTPYRPGPISINPKYFL